MEFGLDVAPFLTQSWRTEWDTRERISRLQENAGTDSTWGTDDDDYGNVHLGYASPVIDQGKRAAQPWFRSTGHAREERQK